MLLNIDHQDTLHWYKKPFKGHYELKEGPKSQRVFASLDISRIKLRGIGTVDGKRVELSFVDDGLHYIVPVRVEGHEGEWGTFRGRSSLMDGLGLGLKSVTELSHAVNPQLDYASEAEFIVRRGLGNVFVLDGDDGPLGCALLHTYQRGEEAPYSSIKAVLVRPDVPETRMVFDRLMSRCETRSLEEGKTKVLTRFSPVDTRLYEAMLARSYALRGANLRMIKTGEYTEAGWCNITSWAG